MLDEVVQNIGPRGAGVLGRDDDSLVEAAKKGDRLAFEALFQRYERALNSRALRITGNHEDAEDIVQQSFQKAFVHLKEFEGRSSFSTWLTRIALNEALMLKRRCCKFREISLDEPAVNEESSVVLEIPDSGPDPEHLCSQQEHHRLLFSAIDELRPGTRVALQIYELSERSVAETARVLGLSAGAVKSRITRGRKSLREKLNQHGALHA